MVDQEGNILFSFSQRGKVDGDDIEPVVKVFPKKAFPDGFLKITVGGSDHPDIDLKGEV